jgi:hypothetical protein
MAEVRFDDEDDGCFVRASDVKFLDLSSTPKVTAPAEMEGYSVNRLSQITGADRRTIGKVVVGLTPARSEGKTKFYRLGDVEEALAHRPAPLKDEKTEEEIRKLRMANDEKAGLLISKAIVADSVRRLQAKVKPLLFQKLMNEYPASVAGMTVAQARDYGGRLFDKVMREFQSWADLWVTPAPLAQCSQPKKK